MQPKYMVFWKMLALVYGRAAENAYSCCCRAARMTSVFPFVRDEK